MTIAPALTDSRVMIGRCLRRSPRDPEAFFTALILPIALMLLFVYVFGGALKTGVAYVDYVVPGLIVLCADFGAGTTAVPVATDMTNGIVDRFRSMPVSGASILVGHVVASVARNLIATMTFILMFIPYVSTAFVPASTMPAVLRLSPSTSRLRRSSKPCGGYGWETPLPAPVSVTSQFWPWCIA